MIRLASGLAIACALVTAETADGPAILAPPDGSAASAGAIDVVVNGLAKGERPPLLVDGTAGSWTRPAGSGLLARIDLKPGEHEIQVGEARSRLRVVGANAVQGNDALLRAHPRDFDDADACLGCHAAGKGDGEPIGGPDTPGACMVCHPAEALEAVHFHPLKPIGSCELCHALHGTTLPKLLRAPAKTLCAKCHE
jgi:predicted CXXCH cytochrome family protein